MSDNKCGTLFMPGELISLKSSDPVQSETLTALLPALIAAKKTFEKVRRTSSGQAGQVSLW